MAIQKGKFIHREVLDKGILHLLIFSLCVEFLARELVKQSVNPKNHIENKLIEIGIKFLSLCLQMIESFFPKLHQKLALILIKFYMIFVLCLANW